MNHPIIVRGKGVWKGVLCIERPKNATPNSMCNVMSARTVAFDGKRAIVHKMPYGQVRRYFSSSDGDTTYAYAELYADGGHLELYEKASMKDFFDTAQGGQPASPIALPS